MSEYIFISVAIMAIFTYLPRMLPLTLFRKEITSPFLKSLLYYVPYAVLSALTFPSIIYATANIYIVQLEGVLLRCILLIRKKGWYLLL